MPFPDKQRNTSTVVGDLYVEGLLGTISNNRHTPPCHATAALALL